MNQGGKMTIEIDLQEYMEMKRKIGFAQGVVLGVAASIKAGVYTNEAILVGLIAALDVLEGRKDV